MKKQAYECMKKIYSYTGVVDSQLQRPGSMGCLAQYKFMKKTGIQMYEGIGKYKVSARLYTVTLNTMHIRIHFPLQCDSHIHPYNTQL